MAKGVGKARSVLLFLLFANSLAIAFAAVNVHEASKCGNLKRPSYEDALQFLRLDQTNKNQYNQTYNCVGFARDLIASAERAGCKCGYVLIEFSDVSHAMVCFDTVDKGPIFIEPQNDEIVQLEVGVQYAGRTVVRLSTYWVDSSSSQVSLVLSLIPLPLLIMATESVIADCLTRHLSWSRKTENSLQRS